SGSRTAAPRVADAVAKYDAARIALFGVPYDRTCSFRGGSRFAPRAIREASYNFETFMMDHQRDLLEVPVADLGDTPAFGPTTEMVGGVTKMASEIVGAGKIPIVIGGEHSLAAAVVRAFPKDIGVIGIDAHLDFRESYLDDPWSHACSARRIADHIGVEHVVYLGVRSYSREEREDLERLGPTYVSAFDIPERGIATRPAAEIPTIALGGNRRKGSDEPRTLAKPQGPNPPPQPGCPRPANPGRPCPPKAAREERHRSSSQPVTDDGRVEHILCEFPRG